MDDRDNSYWRTYTMKRFMTSIAIGTLILGGLTTLGVASASAAGPTITLTPSTGLQAGSVVAVAGTGFQDDETLYALECVNDGAATNQTDCDTNTVSLAEPNRRLVHRTSVLGQNWGMSARYSMSYSTWCVPIIPY